VPAAVTLQVLQGVFARSQANAAGSGGGVCWLCGPAVQQPSAEEEVTHGELQVFFFAAPARPAGHLPTQLCLCSQAALEALAAIPDVAAEPQGGRACAQVRAAATAVQCSAVVSHHIYPQVSFYPAFFIFEESLV
jgi:hypothetical protein